MSLNDGKYDFEEFIELDRGYDFYASQTFIDENRNILIRCMRLPDIDDEHCTNPTVENGWHYALATPRVLELIDNKVYQKLSEELEELRKNKITKD